MIQGHKKGFCWCQCFFSSSSQEYPDGLNDIIFKAMFFRYCFSEIPINGTFFTDNISLRSAAYLTSCYLEASDQTT